MRRVFAVALAVMMLALPLRFQAQTAEDEGAKNAKQARAVLDAMVQALGGDAWLNMKNQEREGRIGAFFHGRPSGGTTEYFEFHQWPDQDRIEFTKHRDVVQFYLGRTGQEVTYKGKAALPQDIVDDFLRRRDHSIETVIKVWLKDPSTILLYEGQRLAERHLADQVTLISAANEAVTIQMDTQTHLPLRRTFQWRDPVYKDKNTDVEEYDDYHVMEGFPTPFTISRYKNDDEIRQYYIVHVKYNQELPADFWSVDAANQRIKK
ncbi:MAG: hypothetical protein ABR976_12305 [Terracidiphilus sp.]|jgi:hypothetical protein